MAKDKKKKKSDEPIVAPPAPRLKAKFDDEVRAKVAEQFGLSNRMAQPGLEKITINVNMGRHLDGTKIPPNIRSTVLDTLTTITGQKPIMLKAKKSVSNFKVREGWDVGLKVTLRGNRMYEFLDRVISLAIPRVRDFRGLNPNSFDGRGNYNLGLTECGVFPEVNPDKVSFQQGLSISICTTAANDTEARRLLSLFGMPFKK